MMCLSGQKTNTNLPVPHDKLIRIDRNSSPAHIGKLENAVDLIVPENTQVLAAAEGIVTYVRDESIIGGPSVAFWDYSNFILIKHLHGEYTRYDHLAPHSSKVTLGQQIVRGQEIAKVGMTGYTYLPHLHFQVFIFTGPNVWEDYRTLKVDF